jgi:hypothetical protein
MAIFVFNVDYLIAKFAKFMQSPQDVIIKNDSDRNYLSIKPFQ